MPINKENISLEDKYNEIYMAFLDCFQETLKLIEPSIYMTNYLEDFNINNKNCLFLYSTFNDKLQYLKKNKYNEDFINKFYKLNFKELFSKLFKQKYFHKTSVVKDFDCLSFLFNNDNFLINMEDIDCFNLMLNKAIKSNKNRINNLSEKLNCKSPIYVEFEDDNLKLNSLSDLKYILNYLIKDKGFFEAHLEVSFSHSLIYELDFLTYQNKIFEYIKSKIEEVDIKSSGNFKNGKNGLKVKTNFELKSYKLFYGERHTLYTGLYNISRSFPDYEFISVGIEDNYKDDFLKNRIHFLKHKIMQFDDVNLQFLKSENITYIKSEFYTSEKDVFDFSIEDEEIDELPVPVLSKEKNNELISYLYDEDKDEDYGLDFILFDDEEEENEFLEDFLNYTIAEVEQNKITIIEDENKYINKGKKQNCKILNLEDYRKKDDK